MRGTVILATVMVVATMGATGSVAGLDATETAGPDDVGYRSYDLEDSRSPRLVLEPYGASGDPGPGPVPLSHTDEDAECEFPVEPGQVATCSDSWDQGNEGAVNLFWHAGFHSVPFGTLATGEVVLEWYASNPEDHLVARWTCTPTVVQGDLGGPFFNFVTGHCDQTVNHNHYHLGSNRIEVTATVDPVASGVDDCPIDRHVFQGTCTAHGELTLD